MITLLFCEVRPLTFLLLKYSCHTNTIVCLDRRHTGSFQLKSFVKHWTVIIDRNAVIRSYMDTAEETPHFVLKVWWHHVSLMSNLKEYLIRVSQCYGRVNSIYSHYQFPIFTAIKRETEIDSESFFIGHQNVTASFWVFSSSSWHYYLTPLYLSLVKTRTKRRRLL